MKRYAFALRYQHWTLEDWKSVIWTDETSDVLGHRRGSYRVWRRLDERCTKSCVRERWKRYSKFMFWGCFTYDFKGPSHIWKTETSAEKKAAIKDTELMNLAAEKEAKEAWELNTAMTRVGLRNRPGRKPTWKFNEQNGAFVRDAKGGGIDWYRYLTHILLPKLLSFATALKYAGLPNVIVMEDKAPAHASEHQRAYFDVADVQRLIWPGNSLI